MDDSITGRVDFPAKNVLNGCKIPLIGLCKHSVTRNIFKKERTMTQGNKRFDDPKFADRYNQNQQAITGGDTNAGEVLFAETIASNIQGSGAEFGCGGGKTLSDVLTHQKAPPDLKIYAVDIDSGQIDRATTYNQSNQDKISFIEYDAAEIVGFIGENILDFVYFRKFIHEIERTGQTDCFQTIADLLKPGGDLFCWVDAISNRLPKKKKAKKTLIKELDKCQSIQNFLDLSIPSGSDGLILFCWAFVKMKDLIVGNKHEVASRYFATLPEIKKMLSLTGLNANYKVFGKMNYRLTPVSCNAEKAPYDSEEFLALQEFTKKHLYYREISPLGKSLQVKRVRQMNIPTLEFNFSYFLIHTQKTGSLE